MLYTDPFLIVGLTPLQVAGDALANKQIPLFAPPFTAYTRHPGDMFSFLDDFFAVYLKWLKNIPGIKLADRLMGEMVMIHRFGNSYCTLEPFPEFDLIRDCRKLCHTLLRAVDEYFKGFPADAYKEMEKLFLAFNGHLLELLPQLEISGNGECFFRVRSLNNGQHCTDGSELFHVPFDKRYFNNSYRFSIAGVPALYCGTTLETCLLETRLTPSEANPQKVAAACFCMPETRWVDLALPGGRSIGFWEHYSLLLFYPLIVACGLKVKHPEGGFKPEYILPQLFYQLIRQHSTIFDGITFTSTRYHAPDFTDFRQRNFVFFVKDTNNERGYSKRLAQKFKVKGPITFDYVSLESVRQEQKKLQSKPANELKV